MSILKQRCSRSLFPELSLHKEKWEGCKDCILHESAKQKVFYRGDLPCQILFIGDAPGPAEDDLGIPFVGPLAPIFNQVLERGLASHPEKLTYAITNAVLCKPPVKEGTLEANRDLTSEEIKACSGRLSQFLILANPKLVVNVGKTADKATIQAFMASDTYYKTVTISHPGFIERSEDKVREVERAVLQLSQAIHNVFQKGKK